MSFSFKQFTINQDQCAMKVCTDACLFGAWVAGQFSGKQNNGPLLDIGTGTGLLSLMIAQQSTVTIDAIEIDPAAAMQAQENFNASPWKERLQVFNEDMLTFNPAKQYGLIVSNPPFYEDDLRPADQLKAAAKHDSTLTLKALFKAIKNLLGENGLAAVLVPAARSSYAEEEALKNGLFVRERMLVKQTPGHPFFRAMLLFSTEENQLPVQEEIIIHDEQRVYTQGFVKLLKPYYLKL